MDTPHIVLLIEFAAIAVLNVFDYLSTLAFLKSGKGYEANPILAWAQKTLGGAWWTVKLLFIPACIVLWFMAAYIGMIANAMAGALALFYLFTVFDNYRIAKNG